MDNLDILNPGTNNNLISEDNHLYEFKYNKLLEEGLKHIAQFKTSVDKLDHHQQDTAINLKSALEFLLKAEESAIKSHLKTKHMEESLNNNIECIQYKLMHENHKDGGLSKDLHSTKDLSPVTKDLSPITKELNSITKDLMPSKDLSSLTKDLNSSKDLISKNSIESFGNNSMLSSANNNLVPELTPALASISIPALASTSTPASIAALSPTLDLASTTAPSAVLNSNPTSSGLITPTVNGKITLSYGR